MKDTSAWTLDELAEAGSADALGEMLLDAARAWDDARRAEYAALDAKQPTNPQRTDVAFDHMCAVAKAYARACRVANGVSA